MGGRMSGLAPDLSPLSVRPSVFSPVALTARRLLFIYLFIDPSIDRFLESIAFLESIDRFVFCFVFFPLLLLFILTFFSILNQPNLAFSVRYNQRTFR
jgi:hypothetical protein